MAEIALIFLADAYLYTTCTTLSAKEAVSAKEPVSAKEVVSAKEASATHITILLVHPVLL